MNKLLAINKSFSRKKRTLILLSFFMPLFWKGDEAFAQKHGQAKVDSLQEVLKTAKEDTNKVNAINAMAGELSNGNPDTAIALGTQALQLAEKIKWQLGIAKSQFNIGRFYYSEDDYPAVLEHCNKALTICDELEKSGTSPKSQIKSLKSKIYSVIGHVYAVQGNYPKVLDYYFKALKIAEDNGDEDAEASLLYYFGQVYEDEGDYPKALDYYFKAMKMGEKLGNIKLSSNVLCNIGNVYLNRGDYPKAQENYFKALKMAEESGNKFGQAMNTGNIGEAYRKQGDSAIAKGNKTYALEDRYAQALDYTQKALKMYEEIDAKGSIAQELAITGEIYLKENKLKEADKFMQDALKIASTIKYMDMIRDENQGLSEVYSKQGDWQKAYSYYKQYVIARDSINNEEKAKKQTRLEMNYEFDKKQAADSARHEKQMAVAAVENKKQKLFRNVSISGFAVMLLFAIVFFTQRNRISKGKKRSDELLLNILPSETAEELKQTGTAKAKSYDAVTVLFTDFKNFTHASEQMSAEELVSEIHHCYSEFDKIISKHNIEKIKTIGDSYMCAGGLPVENKTNPVEVVEAALEIQQFIEREKEERQRNNKSYFEIRIGIHTGPVVAGIVGIKKFAYDIWGDTVNIASRMESSGEVGKVNISGNTYELVKDKFTCTHRGKIDAKNKGMIDMYFVENPVV